MLGFKDFRCARIILSGIEVMHMIRKGQMQVKKDTHPTYIPQVEDTIWREFRCQSGGRNAHLARRVA